MSIKKSLLLFISALVVVDFTFVGLFLHFASSPDLLMPLIFICGLVQLCAFFFAWFWLTRNFRSRLTEQTGPHITPSQQQSKRTWLMVLMAAFGLFFFINVLRFIVSIASAGSGWQRDEVIPLCWGLILSASFLYSAYTLFKKRQG